MPADAAAAGEQLARLLSGEVLGVVSRTVKLDTLRLEQGTSGRADIFDDPTLVAGDVNPASRLTIGKRLGDRVELAFSQNLTDSGFTWSTTYRAPYGLSLRALLLDDQSRSYEFRHEPRFGQSRAARAPRPPGPRVTDVRIGGTPGFTEPEVRSRLQLTRGDRFQFAAWQRDRDRLEELYHSRGFYEARIRARRLPGIEDGVVLEYAIERGPETRLDVRGVALPDDVRARIIERWSSALFDAFLERDATHARAKPSRRRRAPPRHDCGDRPWRGRRQRQDAERRGGPGARAAEPYRVRRQRRHPRGRLHETAQAVGTLAAWIDPPSFARAIESLYRDEGFLAAQVDVAPPEISQGTSVVRVDVREGAPFLVGAVSLEHGDALPERELREALGISPGMRLPPRRHRRRPGPHRRPASAGRLPCVAHHGGRRRPAARRPRRCAGRAWTPGRGPSCGTSSSKAAMRASRSWRAPSR